MLRKVLKAFPYAHDGIEVADLQEGSHVQIRDELLEGLTASGHIGEPDEGAVATGSEPAAEAPPAAAPAPKASKAKAKPPAAAPADPAAE